MDTDDQPLGASGSLHKRGPANWPGGGAYRAEPASPLSTVTPGSPV
jgi:hypothetical protein